MSWHDAELSEARTAAAVVVRVVLLAVVAAALALVLTGRAEAATFTTSCPTTDDACLALAERLEALVAAAEAGASAGALRLAELESIERAERPEELAPPPTPSDTVGGLGRRA